MLRSNMGLVLGGVAAVAVGIVGGWTLVARPVQARAPAIETASIRVTASSPSADEASTPARTPAQTAKPDPAPAPTASPTRAAEVPPPAAPDPAPADDAPDKPRIHLDGERSEISFGNDKGSLRVNKDKLSVRTPLGKFQIDW